MGGLVCAIPRFAILPGDSVPTNPKDFPDFDKKLRKCFAQTDIVHGIFDAGKGERACELLQKKNWNLTERTELYDMLDSLYE